MLRRSVPRRALSVLAGLFTVAFVPGAGATDLVGKTVSPLAPSSNSPLQDCTLLDNGNFTNGLQNWSVKHQTSNAGNAGAGALAEVTAFEEPFDDDVLMLLVNAWSGMEGGAGESSYTITASTTVVVDDVELCMQLGGGFEVFIFGEVGWSLRADVTVAAARGVTTFTAYSKSMPAGANCFPQLSLLGVFHFGDTPVCLDLAAAGITVGETATVTVSLTAGAATLQPCQMSLVTGALLVDRVGFCESSGHPADLNGDGCVDQSDLGILLADFGCILDAEPCAGDINRDGFTNQADLGILLAGFGAGCDGR